MQMYRIFFGEKVYPPLPHLIWDKIVFFCGLFLFFATIFQFVGLFFIFKVHPLNQNQRPEKKTASEKKILTHSNFPKSGKKLTFLEEKYGTLG